MSASLHPPKVDILIVDDTINNINLLSTMLSVEGYGVRKALNGQMALRAAQTVVPDLILLDINMPEMDGYQVCKQLKDIPETAMVPVIFLSALDDVLDKVKAFQVGGVDYITKPFQIEEVMARIQNQLTIRQLQTQLEQSNGELQQALQDLKTTQVQLIQKEKMIGLGQLIAGIAHEINNPISFISCNLAPAREYIHDLLHILKLYQQTYPTPEPDLANAIAKVELPFLIADLTKMMSSMQAGADRIRSIVLALRIFSRLGESDLKAVDVHEGIDSTLLLLQHRLRAESKRSKIHVIREYGDLPVLTCYASLVNQVFLHLLNNAIDALEERRQTHTDARIWIRTTAEAGMAVIAIRDNGVGMPEQVRSRIYEPFFTTKPIGQGSGLGLSASYQIIVEKHGGQLSCSAPGDGGTEFIIQLPSQPKMAEQKASA